ncbi:MAG: hypothetical protein JW843_01900 [Candidatus Aminicenantes bacterium]|nr:hypothetical protein [Candidatus Aminicenantes bacterium]
MPGIEKCYHILGLDLVLRADRDKFLREFDLDFAAFAAVQHKNRKPNLDFAFREKLGGAVDVYLNGVFREEISFSDIPYFYPMVLREIFKACEEFLFFHGGVSAREGAALIISGPPGSGKTTLTMKAVRSGFSFFSDEFCPVEFEINHVHPFPRALRVASGTDPHGKKTVRPVASLGRPVGRKPVRPRCLILLDPVFTTEPRAELIIRTRKEWIDEVAKRLPEGSTRVERYPGSSYGEVILPYSGDIVAQGRLVRKVLGLRDLILETALSELPAVDFSNPPRLERLTPAKAAPLWLSHIYDRSHPVLTEKPGSALFHTAGILRNTACFRMVPGELNETGKLLLSAWKESGIR